MQGSQRISQPTSSVGHWSFLSSVAMFIEWESVVVLKVDLESFDTQWGSDCHDYFHHDFNTRRIAGSYWSESKNYICSAECFCILAFTWFLTNPKFSLFVSLLLVFLFQISILNLDLLISMGRGIMCSPLSDSSALYPSCMSFFISTWTTYGASSLVSHVLLY